VHVPLELARSALVHWGEAHVGGAMFSVEKALRDLEWRPAFGLESGYRDSYEWWRTEGRDRYDYDFSNDDKVLALLTR
jgi:nucleoside-diphosphate-sugar epimerase